MHACTWRLHCSMSKKVTIHKKLTHFTYTNIVVRPVHPASTTTKGPPAGSIHFMIRLEPFDGSYGDLGDFKVIVITGNPVKYNLAPTETQIPDKVLPKANGQSKTKERYYELQLTCIQLYIG